MKKYLILLLIIASVVMYSGCKYDNYAPPKSFLTGTIVYNGLPIGVRSNGTQLELWQYGYKLRSKIAVYIAQDGTYSARLFDGNYKLVRLAGAPWANQTDSIDVTVKGKTVVDVPVTPFYTISGETFTYNKADSSLTSSCSITKVGTTGITNLTLYAGLTTIVDNTNNTQTNAISGAALTDLSTPKTNKITLTSANKKKSFIYARLGIQIAGVGERYFTQVQKISLQ
jgi:hypothetical protein